MYKSLEPVIAELNNRQKAQGSLHVQEKDGKDKYCCLGVLCEVEGLPWQISFVRNDGEESFGPVGQIVYGTPVPNPDKDSKYFDEEIDDEFRIEESELPFEQLTEYGLNEPISDYPTLIPVAIAFGVLDANPLKKTLFEANLQTLLIAVNDNTNADSFKVVREVMRMIQRERDNNEKSATSN